MATATIHDGEAFALARRVIAEREARGRMSVREAAQLGAISNTWWAKFESGEVGVTATVRRGVAKAFDWPLDWPENPPDLTVSEVASLRAEVSSLRDEIRQLADIQERVVGLLEVAADRLGWRA